MNPRIGRMLATKDQQDADARAAAQFQQRSKELADLKQAVYEAIGEAVTYITRSTMRTEVTNPVRSVLTPDVAKVVQAIAAIAPLIRESKPDLEPIQTQLATANELLRQLPTSFPDLPEQREDVRITNFDELDERIARIEQAIAGQKLDVQVQAPDVNVDVPTPQVHVDAPDLAPLLKPLQDLAKWAKTFKVDPAQPTDVTGVEKKLDTSNKLLQKIVDKPVGGGGGGAPTSTFGFRTYRVAVSGTTVYEGEANVGTADDEPGWTIIKSDLSDMSDASGKVATDVTWDNRAAGSYA